MIYLSAFQFIDMFPPSRNPREHEYTVRLAEWGTENLPYHCSMSFEPQENIIERKSDIEEFNAIVKMQPKETIEVEIEVLEIKKAKPRPVEP